jgi:hypothetical protein
VAVADGDAMSGQVGWVAVYRLGKLVAGLTEPHPHNLN